MLRIRLRRSFVNIKEQFCIRKQNFHKNKCVKQAVRQEANTIETYTEKIRNFLKEINAKLIHKFLNMKEFQKSFNICQYFF